jgi:hypothetical protein
MFSTKLIVSFCLRNESQFLLGGLRVDNKPSWLERQAAYKTAVRAFLMKLKPEFESIEIKFVRSLRVDPRLFLAVDCKSPLE